MKKEAKHATEDVEKKYSLAKYPQTEFTLAIGKEYKKYIDKLQRAQKYEENAKEGKELTADMKDLISKKDSAISHLNSLNKAMEIYSKSYTGVVSEKPVQQEEKKNVKEGKKGKGKDVPAIRTLANFLTLGSLLTQKSGAHISTLTPEEQTSLIGLYNEIINHHSANLKEEANNCFEKLSLIASSSAKSADAKMKDLAQAIEKAVASEVVANAKAEAPVEQKIPQPEPKAEIPEPVKAKEITEHHKEPRTQEHQYPHEYHQKYVRAQKQPEQKPQEGNQPAPKPEEQMPQEKLVEEKGGRKKRQPKTTYEPVVHQYEEAPQKSQEETHYYIVPEQKPEEDFTIAGDKKEKGDQRLAGYTVRRQGRYRTGGQGFGERGVARRPYRGRGRGRAWIGGYDE